VFTVYNPRVIIEDTIRIGGGSFTLDGDGVSFDSGYMVALHGYEHQVDMRALAGPRYYGKERSLELHIIVGQYMQYVNRIFRLYEDEDEDMPELRVYIEAWMNKNSLCLNISRNFASLDEAVDMAHYNKQSTIWDCANGREIGV
jgi:hypothetical protein